MDAQLFPFHIYWWFYLGFTIFVFFLLGLDLGLFHKSARKITFKEAIIWSGIWVFLALVFNFLLYRYALWKFPIDPRLASLTGFDAAATARRVGLEFLAGYLVEYSLSVDNIFVFVVVLGYFGIPSRLQHRVLFYGIIGAFALRALFIATGSVLLNYEAVVWLFGGFLIFTGIRMIFSPEEQIDPERNFLIRIAKKLMPVTGELHGHRFFVRINKQWFATPLFVTLVAVDFVDTVFAVDSVPAIFALTREPLIVFTSNVFAILGLRSMYFMLANAMDKFHMLNYGLAAVLMFVGIKMIGIFGKISIGTSLAAIGICIGSSVALSLIFPKREITSDSGE
jgi:tellurite resistance protein TerC